MGMLAFTVVCHHLSASGLLPHPLQKLFFIFTSSERDPDGFSGEAFFLPPREVFLSFGRCSTAVRPCAEKIWMQLGRLAFTEAFMSFQHQVLRTYTFQKFFFIFLIHHIINDQLTAHYTVINVKKKICVYLRNLCALICCSIRSRPSEASSILSLYSRG